MKFLSAFLMFLLTCLQQSQIHLALAGTIQWLSLLPSAPNKTHASTISFKFQLMKSLISGCENHVECQSDVSYEDYSGHYSLLQRVYFILSNQGF